MKMSVEVRQLRDRETGNVFVPVTHWDAVANKPSFDTFNPIGSITMWPLATAPSGWLICNGQTIDGDQYANLRAVLGTNSVPDLTGKFPLGANNSHVTGSTGGSETVTLTTDQMPSHNHEIKSLYHKAGTASTTYRTFNLNSMAIAPDAGDIEDLNPTNYTENTGGGLAHDNMPPYFTLNFIIRYE